MRVSLRCDVKLKELATTGIRLAEVGLGTWQYGGGVKALRGGTELGVLIIVRTPFYALMTSVSDNVENVTCALSLSL